jgi:hypothetical protein
LLPGEPRDRVISRIALGRHAVADLAVLQLGLNVLLGDGVLGACQGL